MVFGAAFKMAWVAGLLKVPSKVAEWAAQQGCRTHTK